MAELAALSPGVGVFPIERGGLRVVEAGPEGLWSVMPFAGRVDAVAAALPCGWPEPGRWVEGGGRRALWSGRGSALVTGPRLEGLDAIAAVVDQSDAWCVVRLEGVGAEDALARLVPLDLRKRAFPDGSATRTLLGHMTVGLARVSGGFEILAMRSMASTLAHELERAMGGVAARRGGA